MHYTVTGYSEPKLMFHKMSNSKLTILCRNLPLFPTQPLVIGHRLLNSTADWLPIFAQIYCKLSGGQVIERFCMVADSPVSELKGGVGVTDQSGVHGLSPAGLRAAGCEILRLHTANGPTWPVLVWHATTLWPGRNVWQLQLHHSRQSITLRNMSMHCSHDLVASPSALNWRLRTEGRGSACYIAV